MSLSYSIIPHSYHNLSFAKSLTFQTSLFFSPLFLPITTPTPSIRNSSLIIRMGGGPRTYPGGVSKWQWKKMQAKKAKQLLKARLSRERQIYEMRKRAELKAAVSELERPWEAVETAPNLFSVSADEQVKVLADRFHKPGGFDMWSERDGPQLFHTHHGLPSARFFPKGVVHSVKPYVIVSGVGDLESEDGSFDGDSSGRVSSDIEEGSEYGQVDEEEIEDETDSESEFIRNNIRKSGVDKRDPKRVRGKGMRKRDGERFAGVSGRLDQRRGVSKLSSHRDSRSFRSNVDRKMIRSNSVERPGVQRLRDPRSEVYDMSLQQDGSCLGAMNLGQDGDDRRQAGISKSRSGGRNFRNNSYKKALRSNDVNKSGMRRLRHSKSEFYDMNLQQDGSCGF